MPRRSPVDVADDALGQLVERLTCSHHRRRLHRVGWGRAIDPRAGTWAEGDPPPRSGNMLEVLIDGAAALPAMAEAIAGARSHVYITGWHITPEFISSAAATRSAATRRWSSIRSGSRSPSSRRSVASAASASPAG